jgi:hypothetical protein
MDQGKRSRGGRPRKELSPGEVYKLAKLGCTDVEIADFFGVSEDTFARRKKDDPEVAMALMTGRADVKMSLRRLQWRSAQKSITMQIWLGKQFLGQSDKVEDTTPMRPAEEGLLLPQSLPPEEHAAMIEALRKKNALPGQGTVN